MDVLVTGGTGFVGANLVRELIGDGHRVRVLARKGGDRRALEGCSVDIAEGDLAMAVISARIVRASNPTRGSPLPATRAARRTSTARRRRASERRRSG